MLLRAIILQVFTSWGKTRDFPFELKYPIMISHCNILNQNLPVEVFLPLRAKPAFDNCSNEIDSIIFCSRTRECQGAFNKLKDGESQFRWRLGGVGGGGTTRHWAILRDRHTTTEGKEEISCCWKPRRHNLDLTQWIKSQRQLCSNNTPQYWISGRRAWSVHLFCSPGSGPCSACYARWQRRPCFLIAFYFWR